MFSLFPEKHIEAYDTSLIKFFFLFRWETLSHKMVNDFLGLLTDTINVDFRNHHVRGELFAEANKESEIIRDPVEYKFEKTGEHLSVGNPFHFKLPPMQIVLDLTEQNAALILESPLIAKIKDEDNLTAVYVINGCYFTLQHALQLDVYKMYNVRPDKVKLSSKNVHGMELIDIKKNPGYAEVVANSWLMAAWKMWFNNEFFANLLGKDISLFPDAFTKSKDEKTTFIQLYENQNEPHFKVSKKRQLEFKEWIGFNDVIKKDKEQ